MEAPSCWTCPHQHAVVFMLLMTLGSGSACEAPSSPECFRRNAEETVYVCEWSLNTTQSSVESSIHFNNKNISIPRMRCEARRAGLSLETTCNVTKEVIGVQGDTRLWVEARLGSTTCRSAQRHVVLRDTVKYEAPRNVSFSWFKNNLNLNWTPAEKLPASAEVRFRRDGNPSEPWRQFPNTTNTNGTSSVCHAVVPDLLQDSAYQVQVRHRSTRARNPLWSRWSEARTAPAELQHKPEVTMTTRLVNGSREVTLTWKPVSRAAESGLRFILTDTQSSLGCPCKAERVTTRGRSQRTTGGRSQFTTGGRSQRTTFVSLAAVSLQLTASNAAGSSPPAQLRLPAHRAEPTRVCGTSVPDPPDKKLQNRTCRQWHQIQDGGSSSAEPVVTLTASTRPKERKRLTKSLGDYVRYLYSEHRCAHGSRPQTLQTCLFYTRQGAPLGEPPDLAASGETLTSANLSWSPIPPALQRGFLTHLVLCSVRLGPQDHVKGSSQCRNISASLTSHRLENLTPGTKYNISLAGVTGAGGGPEATVSINTLPEKTNVWWSLGLLSLFFLLTTMCTCVLKRISNKIFLPVPKPVLPDFILNPPESQQEFLEGKEELDELTLHQSVPEHPEELLLLTGEEDEGEDDRVDMSDEESHSSEDPKSSRGDETDLEQVDNEIAMLIYRNGLVFDLKADESKEEES